MHMIIKSNYNLYNSVSNIHAFNKVDTHQGEQDISLFCGKVLNLDVTKQDTEHQKTSYCIEFATEVT